MCFPNRARGGKGLRHAFKGLWHALTVFPLTAVPLTVVFWKPRARRKRTPPLAGAILPVKVAEETDSSRYRASAGCASMFLTTCAGTTGRR